MNRISIFRNSISTGLAPIAAAMVMAFALAGCASSPKGPPPELARLDSEIARLRADPQVAPNAGAEIDQAQREVDFLIARGRSLDDEVYDHRVYLARRMVQIAEAEGLARNADARAQQLSGERERLIADARARDVQIAQAAADRATATADIERQRADQERQAAELARGDAARAQQDLVALQSKLAALETERTERGLVITLGDVLFEVGRAELKPGAARNLDKLVDALRADPTHAIAIEGHTDSTGAHDYNVDLSYRRANEVRAYLVARGIAPERVTARGLGPDFPVATNASETGRQQNRRVEVIVQQEVARLSAE